MRLEDVPAAAGGGAPGSRLLQHFVVHSPIRRQFLLPQYPAGLDSAEAKQVSPRVYRITEM